MKRRNQDTISTWNYIPPPFREDITYIDSQSTELSPIDDFVEELDGRFYFVKRQYYFYLFMSLPLP